MYTEERMERPEVARIAAEDRRLLLLRPRGFCAGVVRAIEVVRLAIEQLGGPIYVHKEIVHNRHVVNDLAQQGAVFVESLDEVPSGAIVIFSAHGVSPQVRQKARERKLQVIDATCPLVSKVHLEVIRYARQNYTIILIGHRDHDEVVGTIGEAPGSIRLISEAREVDELEIPHPERVVYLTQTTLSVDDTQEIISRLLIRFPKIIGPASQDICYATQNRQMAVRNLGHRAEAVLVVGAKNSSNSNRLVEVAQRGGTAAYLIAEAREILPEWVNGMRNVAVTAGASAPEVLVQQVVSRLKDLGFNLLEEVEWIEENVSFVLPPELRADRSLVRLGEAYASE